MWWSNIWMDKERGILEETNCGRRLHPWNTCRDPGRKLPKVFHSSIFQVWTVCFRECNSSLWRMELLTNTTEVAMFHLWQSSKDTLLIDLHPGKLTWNQKCRLGRWTSFSIGWNFRFHVNLLRCIPKSLSNSINSYPQTTRRSIPYSN